MTLEEIRTCIEEALTARGMEWTGQGQFLGTGDLAPCIDLSMRKGTREYMIEIRVMEPEETPEAA